MKNENLVTALEDYRREFLFILFEQKKIIIKISVIITVLAFFIAIFFPKTYSASGSLLVRGKKMSRGPETLEHISSSVYPLTKEDLFSELQIIISHDVITKTIDKIKQNNQYIPFTDEENLNDEIYSVQSNIEIEVVPATNVIQILFLHHNPEYAVLFLEALMNQYIEYRHEIYSAKHTKKFITEQLENFDQDLRFKEKQLLDIVEKTSTANPKQEIETIILIKKNLEEQLNLLKTDSIETKILMEHLDSSFQEEGLQHYSFIDNRVVNDLTTKLMELNVEKGKILRVYHENSEQAKAIKDQIIRESKLLKNEVVAYRKNLEDQLSIYNKKIESIHDRLNKLNKRNAKLQKQMIATDRIVREKELLQFSYETFYKRQKEADIDSKLDPASLSLYVSILSKAFSSSSPYFPKSNVVIPFGILFGLLTGLSLGFMKSYFEHTFRRPSDVYKYLDLPVIFSVEDNNIE